MNEKMMKASRGLVPADLVLKNGYIINGFSEEIYCGDVAIVDDTIVGIGNYKGIKEIDCKGKYLSAGFIDAHMHIETTMVTPLEFAKSVITKGTTTIIVDPHEIVNVSGKKGLDYMIESSENCPVNTYIMIPSCVPSDDIDINGAGEFLAEDMIPYLNHKRVLGLGEVMRFRDVIHCEKRIKDKIEIFSNQIIDGHAPGISGKDVQSYRLAGICNGHECENADEAIEKLRAGFYLMIREGSGAKNLEKIIKGLLEKNIDFERCLFCTDDKHLDEIDREGHIDYRVKKAIKLGVPPIKAYKMATIHSARAYELKQLGAIAPGYKADILIIDQLENVEIDLVLKDGKLIDNEVLKTYQDNTKIDESLLNTVHCESIKATDLAIKQKDYHQVMELVPYSLLTKITKTPLPGNQGYFEPNQTYSKLCVVERHGKTGQVSVCALKGYGIKHGAVATSVSRDSHNIIVAGDCDEDIILAVDTLREIKGGYVIVSKGKVMANLPLKIAGLMSLESKEVVQKKVSKMVEIAHSLNVSKQLDPFITLSFMALTVIPEIRLCEAGLYDVNEQKFIEG